MSAAQDDTNALMLAMQDEGKGLEVLKKALKENGFKACQVSTNIMLAQMEDDGLPHDAAIYYGMLAVKNLPQLPAEATE